MVWHHKGYMGHNQVACALGRAQGGARGGVLGRCSREGYWPDVVVMEQDRGQPVRDVIEFCVCHALVPVDERDRLYIK